MPLLVTESGGADGGASRLTPQAQELVRRFRVITAGVQGGRPGPLRHCLP